MRKLAIIFSALFVLGVLNFSIYQKEKILADGEEVFLTLVPRDPRSLIQGDYMVLNFEVEDTALKKELATVENGYIVLEIDNKKIATFKSFYKNKPLKENERLIKYRFNKNNFPALQLQPNSFLFQEGQGHFFQQAKFAIFHYNGEKDYVLVGLADKDRKIIKPPKTKLLEKYDPYSK